MKINVVLFLTFIVFAYTAYGDSSELAVRLAKMRLEKSGLVPEAAWIPDKGDSYSPYKPGPSESSLTQNYVNIRLRSIDYACVVEWNKFDRSNIYLVQLAGCSDTRAEKDETGFVSPSGRVPSLDRPAVFMEVRQ